MEININLRFRKESRPQEAEEFRILKASIETNLKVAIQEAIDETLFYEPVVQGWSVEFK